MKRERKREDWGMEERAGMRGKRPIWEKGEEGVRRRERERERRDGKKEPGKKRGKSKSNPKLI